MKCNWKVSLFIGKCWRFGAGNRSCVSLPPGSASGSPARKWRSGARPFFFFWLCPPQKRKEKERVCEDVWKHSFSSANLCPHACTEEGKPYLSEQHPHTLDPLLLPHPPQLFIKHIIGEYKQRLRVFNCAAARLWSASLLFPRILSSN